jgi:hypothetical protein
MTWIEERGLSVRTAELYRGLLRNHITPWLGHVAVADVAPPAVRRWRRNLRDAGASVGTMAKAYRLLHAVLNTAVEDGRIRANPSNIKGAGTYEPDERPVATRAGVRARRGDPTALPTGGAAGDVCEPALRRDHRSAAAAPARRGRPCPHRAGGDSAQPRPDLRWRPEGQKQPDVDAARLHGRRDRAPPPTYVGRSPNAYVFLGPKGARPTRANFHRIWSKARAKVGVPDLHLHDLQHTGNTLAAETGATLRELMNCMGTGSPRAELIYLHARDHRDREIAVGLDRIVADARNGPRGTRGARTTTAVTAIGSNCR